MPFSKKSKPYKILAQFYNIQYNKNKVKILVSMTSNK